MPRKTQPKKKTRPRFKPRKVARVKRDSGYRSGLEEHVASLLHEKKVKFEYETVKVKYLVPPKNCTYNPDFILPNGIIVETKGRFTSEDRYKHLLVKEQHPELNIRFVFSNSKNKLYKKSPTTYGDWCTKYGFIYHDKEIPEEWLKIKRKSI